MCDTTNDPAKYEVRSVIRFLNASKLRTIEIFIQITEVYGNVMNEASVRKWCIMFNSGRTNMHDDKCSGRPSVVTDEFKGIIERKIQKDRRFTTDGLLSFISEISRIVIHGIVSGDMFTQKLCKVGKSTETSEWERYCLFSAVIISMAMDLEITLLLVMRLRFHTQRLSMEWYHLHSQKKKKRPNKF